MSNPCELPPCPPCPPLPPQPVPQVCPPPPPPPPCRVKPNMRGLHHAQTMSLLYQGIFAGIVGGVLYYLLIAKPRREAYREFYEKGEFEEWADEMARKGLFQSVPKESLDDSLSDEDKKKKKK